VSVVSPSDVIVAAPPRPSYRGRAANGPVRAVVRARTRIWRVQIRPRQGGRV